MPVEEKKKERTKEDNGKEENGSGRKGKKKEQKKKISKRKEKKGEFFWSLKEGWVREKKNKITHLNGCFGLG